MKVIVDTCIWSHSLRRKKEIQNVVTQELQELILEHNVQMIGPIRQEILAGLKSRVQYKKLRDHLRAFPDLDISSVDYENAADYYNICRQKGVQGSNTDFLICAVSVRYKMNIFTIDEDFSLFKEHLPITLHLSRF